jgi:CDP-diacylglycerol---glycerol-3-phosphate 3-phosphatidyltransferase
MYCLTMGAVTSYARARAESLGMQAKVGIAARADRLVAILAVTGVADLVNVLGAGERALWAVPVILAVLAVASTLTVVQRILVVRTQAHSLAAQQTVPAPEGTPPPDER